MLLVMACGAAFVAGLVDAVAGGGGLIQLPALLVIFPDTPLPFLLGTNKVASVSGTLAALARYIGRVAIPWRAVAPAAGAAFVGSFFGARLVAWLPTAWMRPTVIVLLAGVALFTFLRRDFGATTTAQVRDPVPVKRVLGGVAMGAVLGLYDGFFGPGTGSFLLFGFVMLLGLDFLGASASAKVVNVVTNLAAILAFAWAGQVWWGVAVPMAACNVAGSQVGSRLALARGAPFVRQLFLAVVLLLLGRMTWEWVG